MWYRSLFGILTLYLTVRAGVCCAQSEHYIEKPSLEMDWDLRTRSSGGSKSNTGLYAGSLRLKSGISEGLNIEAYAVRKSADMLTLRGSSDLVLQQAVLEKEWGAQQLQLGMIRLPFGLYNYQETYASGLIDYPMPRVDFGLETVDWGVPGTQWTGGTSRFQVEAAAFEGRAANVWDTMNTIGGGAARVQTYMRDLILGVSRWDGFLDLPYGSGSIHRSAVHENGVDVRYTRSHLLLRGEFLFGVLGGNRMQGWYLDTYYRLPKFEKFTLVARVEALRPDSDDPTGRQITFGVRYTASSDWILALNWRRNNLSSAYPFSWTPYSGRNGDVLLQVYHKIRF